MTKLEARLIRALKSGSQMDFTYRNLRASVKRPGREVRRALQRMRVAGLVVREQRVPGALVEWRAA